MSRRRRQGLSPSLFPFLAVLVCTLGTLILLLALVAQNATSAAEQNARARQQAQAKRESASAEPPRMSRTAVEELLREEEFRVNELVAVRDQQTTELESKRDELTHLDDHIARLRQQIEQLNEEVRQATGELVSPKITDAELTSLRDKIATEKEQVDKLREDAADKSPRIVIVPHKGPNGTDRRPIYLECTAEGISIWPEGSRITFDQLENSGYSANPLDAALRTIRMHTMQNYGDSVPPYPLLVVRPDGIETYGAARRAMRDWDDQFGYELVPADVKLAFSKPDANLKRRIDIAINNAVAEQRVRVAMMQRAAGSGGVIGDSHRGGAPPRKSLPVLSAAALDRDGRANGFAPLRDEYRGPASSASIAGSPYSAGPQIGSVSQNPYAGGSDFNDSGANARRMAERMQAAATDLRAADDDATPGTASGGSPLESTAGGSSPFGKHYSDPVPVIDPPSASDRSTGERSENGTSAAGHESLAASALPNQGEIGASWVDPNRIDMAASTSQGEAGPDAGSGVNSDTSSAAGGNGLPNVPSQIAKQALEAPGNASGAPGSQSSMAMPSMQQPNSPVPTMQGSATMMGSPITMQDENLSNDPRLAGKQPELSLTPASTAAAELVTRQGRDWALPSSVAGMHGNAIIRTLRLQCHPDRFVLLPAKGDGATEVFGFFNGDVDRASLELATALRDRIEKWGPALPGGKWQPRLEVDIKPDSEMRFHQLRTLMDGSGIELVGRLAP